MKKLVFFVLSIFILVSLLGCDEYVDAVETYFSDESTDAPTENDTNSSNRDESDTGRDEENSSNEGNESGNANDHVCEIVTSVIASEASCNETGTKNYLCSCGRVLSVETIPAEHQSEQIVEGRAATCTETGLTDGKKCTACGTVTLEQTIIDALDHDYEGVITTAPTCTDNGIMTYTCKNDTNHTYTGEVEALDHDYEGVITTAPTCTDNGIMTYICKNDANHTYTTSVQRYSHNIENGKCTLCQGKSVSTVADLKNISYGLSGKYILVNDIHLEGISWTPIGYSGAPFAGSFDGNGYAISNFKVYSAYDETAGLFGYSTGVILNLGVRRVTISVSAGAREAGCLVGINCGKITNCYATGTVSINESYSVTNVGGLVGLNYGGTLANCYAAVEVSGKNTAYGQSYINAGGLVGRNYNGTIMNCYATGDVEGTSSNSNFNHSSSNSHTGGLVGLNDANGTITNCYATGDVSGYSYGGNYSYSFVGGLVGMNNHSIMNCYATGNITANSRNKNSSTNYSYCYAGGLVGGERSAGNSYCYTGQTYRITSCSTYKSPNSWVEKKDMSVLQSVTFGTSTLGWSADCWVFSEGSHPTLKNVGTIN